MEGKKPRTTRDELDLVFMTCYWKETNERHPMGIESKSGLLDYSEATSKNNIVYDIFYMYTDACNFL
jgi:hypothetical protein